MIPAGRDSPVTLRKLTFLAFLVFISAVAYVTTEIAAYGVQFPPAVTQTVTVLAFIFALLHSADRFGWKHSLLLFALTFTVSLLFETVGVATGKVYGPYHYSDLLGPKFLGLVPFLIPVAWFMMMYPSFVIATRITPHSWRGTIRLAGMAAVGAFVMTAWDLVMDPLMVASGHWVWEVKGAYFGIPLQNFGGWWLTTFVTFALFLLLGGLRLARSGRRSSWFDQLAVASYLIIGLSNIIVVASISLDGPGLVGLFAMLPWGLMGWTAR